VYFGVGCSEEKLEAHERMFVCVCVCVPVSPLHKSVPISVGNSAVGGWRSGRGQGAAM